MGAGTNEGDHHRLGDGQVRDRLHRCGGAVCEGGDHAQNSAGLVTHIGSQILTLAPFRAAFARIADLIAAPGRSSPPPRPLGRVR